MKIKILKDCEAIINKKLVKFTKGSEVDTEDFIANAFTRDQRAQKMITNYENKAIIPEQNKAITPKQNKETVKNYNKALSTEEEKINKELEKEEKEAKTKAAANIADANY